MRQLTTKAFYGSVETGVNAVETFIRLHLLVFYAQSMKLPTPWVGSALAISILWDAAIDPLIGRLSDQFKAEKGTRIHLVLAGAIGTALSLSALFHPPSLHTQNEKWLYLLILGLLFSSCQTLFSVPYSAMVGDYSWDRQERSRYIAWRLAFSNLGGILGIAIPGYYLARSDGGAYGNASWLIAMLVLAVAFLGSLVPPPLQKRTVAEKLQTRHPLLQAFVNGPFLLALASSVFVNIGLIMFSSMALYYYRLRLHLGEKEIQNALLLFFLLFSVSMPFWLWISRRIGRKSAMILGAVLWGGATIWVYPWLPEGDAQRTYWFASTVGGFFAGSSVLLDSLLTDVVDYDHFKSGLERFGLYFGVWKFSGKFSRALSMLWIGFLLDWANVAFPDPETSTRLTTIFGPGVGLFFLLAALLLLPYPLTEKRCLEIRSQLEKRDHG